MKTLLSERYLHVLDGLVRRI